MYRFYEKPTSSSLCTLEVSATSWAQQRSTLSQEVVGRLHNTSRELGQRDREEVLERFEMKLRRSGYKKQQVREIVRSGIISYMKKWENRAETHRRATETENLRREKKLLGKTSWYKKTQSNKSGGDQRRNHRGTQPQGGKGCTNRRPSAVLFIERTRGGKLISRLREKEAEINKLSLRKVKLVERNGRQVQQVLTSPDPWGDEVCERRDCLACEGGDTEGRVICRTRNVVYSTRCKVCKEGGVDTRYIGETSRSLYERISEHTHDVWSSKELSHMRTHLEAEH